MVKYNIAQALKLKNRLVQYLRKTQEIFCKENSREVGKWDATKARDARDRYLFIREVLIDIKVLIANATLPVRHQIYELSELKSLVTELSTIPTKEGTEFDRYNSAIKIEYKTFLTERDVEDWERATNKRIDALQDELDAYNATHHVEIDQKIIDIVQ